MIPEPQKTYLLELLYAVGAAHDSGAIQPESGSVTLVFRAHVHPDAPRALVTLRVFVGVEGTIHRCPAESLPADGASVDIGWALEPRARWAARACKARHGGRRRDSQWPCRSQFDGVTWTEDLRSDGRALHPINAIRTVVPGVTSDGIQYEVSLGSLAERIRLYAAYATVVGEVNA